jgi:hypothetical protein
MQLEIGWHSLLTSSFPSDTSQDLLAAVSAAWQWVLSCSIQIKQPLSYFGRRRAAVVRTLAQALAPLLPDACHRLIADSALFLGARKMGPPPAFALSTDGCKSDVPHASFPDTDSPCGFAIACSTSAKTPQLPPPTYGKTGVHGTECGQQAHGAQDLSDGRLGSDLPEVFTEDPSAAGLEKPGRWQGGKVSGESVAVLLEQLHMNPLTLRFASPTMEAAYVAAMHAKTRTVRL